MEKKLNGLNKEIDNSKRHDKCLNPAMDVKTNASMSIAKGNNTNPDQLMDLMYDIQQEEANSHLEPSLFNSRLLKLFSEKQKLNSKLLGVLSRCSIPGCDVHTLGMDSSILEHFTPSQKLSSEFDKARKHINQSPDCIIVIMVFEDHLEEVYLDGSIKAVA